jgi:multiple sugar transport system substrate-binding protein
VLQKFQDLIYVHHVSPSPAQTQTLPSTDVLLQTGKVGMVIDGHWKILDFAGLKMNWGMGVMPTLKKSQTVFLCAPSSILAASKNPQQAFTFFSYMRQPDKVDLYSKGLWMPIIEDYYTDPAKTQSWLTGAPGVYPPEANDVLADFVRNNSAISPTVWLKNQQQIFSEAIDPATSALWAKEMDAQQAADQAVEKAKPMMKGRWRTAM